MPVNSEAAAAHPAHRTLAADGLLGRLDYLSTVSGGGYTGGMYGRLVATYGLHSAQALMARAGSPVLEWLRRRRSGCARFTTRTSLKATTGW